MYKHAAMRKIRFGSVRGDLTVEHLFDMPLKSTSGFDLDTIARDISRNLKALGEESFVEDTSDDPRRKELEVSLEIVKDVIKTKQETAAAAVNIAKRREDRRKILDALSAKKDQQLTAASIEELEQKLAALDT